MDYDTYFHLNKIQGRDEDYDALLDDIERKEGIDFKEDNGQTSHWYDSHEDMLALSRKYPDLTVQLDGDGENSGDLWSRRYHNGDYEEQITTDFPFFELASKAEKEEFLRKTYTTAEKNMTALIEAIVREKGGEIKNKILIEDRGNAKVFCNRLWFKDGELWDEHSIETVNGKPNLTGNGPFRFGLTLDDLNTIAKHLLTLQ